MQIWGPAMQIYGTAVCFGFMKPIGAALLPYYLINDSEAIAISWVIYMKNITHFCHSNNYSKKIEN